MRLPEFLDIRPYTLVTFVAQEIFLVLISVRSLGDPRVIVPPEG